MSVSTSRLAYQDCYDLYDKALAADRGIRIKQSSYENAFKLRLRLHSARKIDRRDNAQTYPEDHAMHGRSVWDNVQCTIDGTLWEESIFYVVLEKISERRYDVEELGDAAVNHS